MKDLLPPLTLVATGLAACLVCPPAEADEARPTIRLGQVGLSVSAVTGAVVPELLERDGHEVELTVGSHAGIFPRLGAGEVDILAATWRPGGHAALFAPVEDVTFRITARDDDARFHRAVPHDAAEDAVASIADLAKPEVQARMPARIVSRPEATGLTTGGRRVMEASALRGAGDDWPAAAPSAWPGTVREAVEAGEWVVFPLWGNAAFEVRPLTEPRGAYGPRDTAYLLGRKSLRGKLSPATLERLSALEIPVGAVTEMGRLVDVEGLSPREAARASLADTSAVTAARGG